MFLEDKNYKADQINSQDLDKEDQLEAYLNYKEEEDMGFQTHCSNEEEEEDFEEVDQELIKKFKSMSPQEIEEEIKKALEQVRPFLLQDGGDLEYVGFENSVVKIRLQGACTSCPQSTYTLKLGIENFLKEKVPVVYEVEAVD